MSQATSEAIEVNVLNIEDRGSIRIITINRPQALNAINMQLSREMDEAFAGIEADPNVRVGILTGTGRAFCVGADLKSDTIRKGGHLNVDDRGFCGLTQRVRVKPLISAVNGLAYGGGFALCLASDMVVASKDARFALPEAQHGKIAVHGGLLRMARALPPMIVSDMSLTGRPITADRAYQVGLVSRLAEAGGALDAAIELAEQVVLASPEAAWATKKLIDASASGRAEEDVWAMSWEMLDIINNGVDTKEGTIAFNEGRAPRWTGH